MLPMIVSLDIGLGFTRVLLPLPPVTSPATPSNSLTFLSLGPLLQTGIICCHGNETAHAKGWRGLAQNRRSINGTATAVNR